MTKPVFVIGVGLAIAFGIWYLIADNAVPEQGGIEVTAVPPQSPSQQTAGNEKNVVGLKPDSSLPYQVASTGNAGSPSVHAGGDSAAIAQNRTQGMPSAERLGGGAVSATAASPGVTDRAGSPYVQGRMALDDASVSGTQGDKAADLVEDVTSDDATEASDAEQKTAESDETVHEFNLIFAGVAASTIGALELQLSWDSSVMRPTNPDSVCTDNSRAMLFDQSAVMGNTVKMALLYPSGIKSSTSTLMTCSFSQRAGTDTVFPEVVGSVLDLNGSQVADASAVLHLRR